MEWLMRTEGQTKTFSLYRFFSTINKGICKIAEKGDLDINEVKLIRIKGKEIVLCRSEAGYFALQERCSHKKAYLSKGVMIAGTITCLKHGCQFDVETGNVKKGPASKALRTYRVFEKDNSIYIKL